MIVSKRLLRGGYGSICVAAAIVLSSWIPAAASDSGPTSSDLRAYSVGKSYARSFEDYLMPGTCGIVLERQRCRDDFAAVKKFAGHRKMDDQVSRWLKLGDVDHRVVDWEGVAISEDRWKKDPAFAWWYTAGTLSIAATMPNNEGTNSFVTSIVDTLVKHADAAPPQFGNLIDAGSSPSDRAKRLLEALNAAIPPKPFPVVSISTGDPGYAQLGVLSNTVIELFDNPLALSRPESRLFALAVVDQCEAVDRTLGGSFLFDALRKHLRGDISNDNAVIDKELRQPWMGGFGQLKNVPQQRDAFVLGSLTAQAAYNAAILKDRNADSSYLRGVISHTRPYAGMSAAAMAAVRKMQNIPYADWPNVNATASAATLAIIGS